MRKKKIGMRRKIENVQSIFAGCWLLVAGCRLPQHQPPNISYIENSKARFIFWNYFSVRFEADASFAHTYFFYIYLFPFFNCWLLFHPILNISLYFSGTDMNRINVPWNKEILNLNINDNYFWAGQKQWGRKEMK